MQNFPLFHPRLIMGKRPYNRSERNKKQFSLTDRDHGCKKNPTSKEEPIKLEIFDLFTRSTNAGGVQGLGLTMVKELASQHNVDVWVEPTDEKGAAFFVSLAKSPPAYNNHSTE